MSVIQTHRVRRYLHTFQNIKLVTLIPICIQVLFPACLSVTPLPLPLPPGCRPHPSGPGRVPQDAGQDDGECGEEEQVRQRGGDDNDLTTTTIS